MWQLKENQRNVKYECINERCMTERKWICGKTEIRRKLKEKILSIISVETLREEHARKQKIRYERIKVK